MRYNGARYETETGKLMARFSRIMSLFAGQEQSDFFRDAFAKLQLRDQVAAVKLEAAKTFEGYTPEEFAIELLSDTISRILKVLGDNCLGKLDADDNVTLIVATVMCITTVNGIALRAGVEKVAKPL